MCLAIPGPSRRPRSRFGQLRAETLPERCGWSCVASMPSESGGFAGILRWLAREGFPQHRNSHRVLGVGMPRGAGLAFLLDQITSSVANPLCPIPRQFLSLKEICAVFKIGRERPCGGVIVDPARE